MCIVLRSEDGDSPLFSPIPRGEGGACRNEKLKKKKNGMFQKPAECHGPGKEEKNNVCVKRRCPKILYGVFIISNV